MTLKVGLRHARMIRRHGGRPLCRGGIERWCDRYGVPWDQFAGEGVPEEVIAAIDDHYAGVLIGLARKEADADGQQ